MAERHVVPDRDTEGGWKVVGAETGGTEAHTTTQAAAIEEALEAVERGGGGEVLIHDTTGHVRERRTVEPGGTRT